MLTDLEKQFINKNLDEDVKKLALKYHSKKDLNYPFVIQQIAAKQKTKLKIPSFFKNEEIIYPPQLNLEQSSSEITAKYKASILSGKLGCDLTGGFGIDSAFISPNFGKFNYVEPNKDLLKIVKHNFKTLSLKNITVHNTVADDFFNESNNKFDCIYIDPSRRTNKGKVVFLEDYEPNVIELQNELIKNADVVLIKTSPMLDITSTLKRLNNVIGIHIIAIKNEVKEVLYLLNSNLNNGEIIIKTINFTSDTTFQKFEFIKGKIPKTDYSLPQSYLYEPNKAIMKSGGFDQLLGKYPFSKLHPNSNLFTSDEHYNGFEGRVFKIKSINKYSKSGLKNILKANITIRNFPHSVEQVRKKLKIKDGGSIYLFATTDINDKPVILNCEKIS